MISAFAVAVLGICIATWSLAQPVQNDPVKQRLGEPDEPPAQRAERELARLAILEPVAFEKELRKHKSAEEVQAEQIAIFSISQPRAYSTEFDKFKDPQRRQQERAAREAVLDPVKHSGSVENLQEELQKKKDRGEQLDEIFEPKFISGRTPNRPKVKAPRPIKP